MSRTSLSLSLSLWHTPTLSEGGGGGRRGAFGNECLSSRGESAFCTCGVILKLHFSHRGAWKRLGGSEHEKTTWSSVVLRAAPLLEPPARLNSGRGRPLGKSPLTGPWNSRFQAHTRCRPARHNLLWGHLSHIIIMVLGPLRSSKYYCSAEPRVICVSKFYMGEFEPVSTWGKNIKS